MGYHSASARHHGECGTGSAKEDGVASFVQALLKRHFGILLVYISGALFGLCAIDFGTHWDEHWAVESAKYSLLSGRYLPRDYAYPGMCYLLSLLALLPHALMLAVFGADNGLDFHRAMVLFSRSPDYLLDVRALSVLVSMLAVFWIYGTVLSIGRGRLAGIWAGALYALSWEVVSHSRFAVPDAIMAQFGALSMFSLARYHRTLSRGALAFAASAAGLAASTKYPGGACMVSVGLAILLNRRRDPAFLRHGILCGLVFILSYLAITPGTVLDWQVFRSSVQEQWGIQTGGWGIYSVHAGLEHAGLIVCYLFLAGFSFYPALAGAVGVFAVLGFIRELKSQAIWLVIFGSSAVFYFLFFSRMQVMIGRNMLFLFPFVAVLAGDGIDFLWWRSSRQAAIRGFIGLFAGAVFLFNAQWIVRTSQTITKRDSADVVSEALDYVRENAQIPFVFSETFRKALAERGAKEPSNAVSSLDVPGAFVIFSPQQDIPEQNRFRANHFNYLKRWFGPHILNLNYYPSWPGTLGGAYLFVMSADEAKSLGVRISGSGS